MTVLISIGFAVLVFVVGFIRHRRRRHGPTSPSLNEREVAETSRPLVTHVEVLPRNGRPPQD